MKKVQLVEVYCDPDGYTDDYTCTRYSHSGETQWEDISDEDFDLLLKACKDHNKKETEYRYVVLVFSEKRPEPVIADYLNKIREYQAKEEEKRIKKEEAAKKAAEAKAIADKKKKQALLEQLQRELGSE